MTEPIIATKELLEGVFDRAAAQYDRAGPRIFERFGARLVEWLTIVPGARVLDVATGRGAVLISAARRVGANGRVVGTDLSHGMLDEIERTVREMEIPNVELSKMDAEHLEFPDGSFDLVTCGFGLLFFPAMDAALREMFRVCKPGGRVGVSLWGKAPFDPAWKIFADQIRAYGVEVRQPQRIAYDPDGVRVLLANAGFANVETMSETREAVYATEEDWWQFQFTLAARVAIERMDDATRARFREEYLAKLRPLIRQDGLHLPAPVIYARAQKG